MRAAILLTAFCSAAATGCDDREPRPAAQPTARDPCAARCSETELAGHAFVELLKADRYWPQLDLDAVLRRLHAELCVGRPLYIPDPGQTRWLEHEYPLSAVMFARSARCGELEVGAGLLLGPRAQDERDRRDAMLDEERRREWANEYLGSALLYLLRFDARSYEAEIEMVFDLMCGTEASSQHLHDASAFDSKQLKEYAYATCDGFSYGNRTR